MWSESRRARIVQVPGGKCVPKGFIDIPLPSRLGDQSLLRTILAVRCGVTHVLMVGLLVQHSALGIEGVLGFSF